jgi:hypothetical protein
MHRFCWPEPWVGRDVRKGGSDLFQGTMPVLGSRNPWAGKEGKVLFTVVWSYSGYEPPSFHRNQRSNRNIGCCWKAVSCLEEDHTHAWRSYMWRIFCGGSSCLGILLLSWLGVSQFYLVPRCKSLDRPWYLHKAQSHIVLFTWLYIVRNSTVCHSIQQNCLIWHCKISKQTNKQMDGRTEGHMTNEWRNELAGERTDELSKQRPEGCKKRRGRSLAHGREKK